MKREQVLPHVMADMAARIAKGAAEYGEPLTTFNGRKPLQDAYEEALDLALYLKQELLERVVSDALHDGLGVLRANGDGSVDHVTQEEFRAPDWPGPDWSQAPDVSQFTRDRISGWKMGAHGIAFWLIDGGIWGQAPDFGYTGDWRYSLRKRPA